MQHFRYQSLLAFVLLVVGAASAASVQDDRRPIRIVINNQPVVSQGAAALDDVLPSPQQLQAVIISPAVRELVDQLDGPEFAERAWATRKLIDLRIDDNQLLAVLHRGELSAEQNHRLLFVMRQRLLNTPRGALGIRMDAARPVLPQNLQQHLPDADEPAPAALPGVLVLEVIPGMPAEGILRAGDRITHIDNTPVQISDDLIDLVQTRRPGDTIHMTVLRPKRDGQGRFINDAPDRADHDQVKLQIILGSVEKLHDPTMPTPPSRLELQRRRMLTAIEHRYGNKARAIEIKQP